MLPQCCLNVGRRPPMLWQCCGNIEILVKIRWYNIHTTLSGCPRNVVGTFKSIYKWTSPQRWDRRWDNIGTNIVTTLPQRWSVSWVLPLSHINVNPPRLEEGDEGRLLLATATSEGHIMKFKNWEWSGRWNSDSMTLLESCAWAPTIWRFCAGADFRSSL